MLKRVLSVIGGVLAAYIAIFFIEFIGGQMYPGVKLEGLTPEEIAVIMGNMPTGAYVMLLFGYTLGSVAGGMVTALISGRNDARPSLIVGGLLLVGGIADIIMIPGQPLWVNITSILLYIPFAYIGFLTVKKE